MEWGWLIPVLSFAAAPLILIFGGRSRTPEGGLVMESQHEAKGAAIPRSSLRSTRWRQTTRPVPGPLDIGDYLRRADEAEMSHQPCLGPSAAAGPVC